MGAPGYGCLFSWQFFCYIPDGLVIHASNSEESWGQVLGYDGCYDSDTCPHGYGD